MDNIAYKEEPRYEIINGETIMMSPRPAPNHNRVITSISSIFRNYLKGKRCEAFSDGVDVHLDEKNTVIPDVMIICNKDIIKGDGIYGTPDLIVEVLSPSSTKRDKIDKKLLYQKFGVKEYWIVSPSDKSIEVYLLVDGIFELNNVYNVYPELQWNKMNEEEKAVVTLSFKVSLYDDFIIDVREIFENVD